MIFKARWTGGLRNWRALSIELLIRIEFAAADLRWKLLERGHRLPKSEIVKIADQAPMPWAAR